MNPAPVGSEGWTGSGPLGLGCRSGFLVRPHGHAPYGAGPSPDLWGRQAA